MTYELFTFAVKAVPIALVVAFAAARIAYAGAKRKDPGAERTEKLRSVSGIIGLVMGVVLAFYAGVAILLAIAVSNM